MPFEIVRNDIVHMQVDAVVNTANPWPVIGSGVDAGIHAKAGPALLEARKQIGCIGVGNAAITPGFQLNARYVIHAVGPAWKDGLCGEETLLRQCYESTLQLALEHQCRSVAFPLISAGNYGFPKELALQIAIGVFRNFLMQHELQIYLVVFDRGVFQLSEQLFSSVDSYIDEQYVSGKIEEEYCAPILNCGPGAGRRELKYASNRRLRNLAGSPADLCKGMAVAADCVQAASKASTDLDQLLLEPDEGFSEALLKLIDKTGKKDSEIYKRANVDRKLFSKIRNNPDYRPSKVTAVAFAIALELNLEETQRLIGRAGYTLSHSSKFDIIIEYFILQKNYDVFEIDTVLFHYDQPLICGK